MRFTLDTMDKPDGPVDRNGHRGRIRSPTRTDIALTPVKGEGAV